MSIDYTLNWSDDSLKPPFKLKAARVDTHSTSLTLTGKNLPDWGEKVQEDALRLLEHFASNDKVPANPTIGQLWWNSTSGQLVMYSKDGWVVVWPWGAAYTPPVIVLPGPPVVIPPGIIEAIDLNMYRRTVAPYTASITVSFNPDGSLTFVGYEFGSTIWFNPVTPLPGVQPGTLYWIRMTKTGSVAPVAGWLNIIEPLTSTRTWTWTKSYRGVYNIDATIEIFSDALGATLVSTGTITGILEVQ